MRVRWTQTALDRVVEISDYIALDSPMSAEHWVSKVFDKADCLPDFTDRYRKLRESSNPNDREIIFGNYRIIFRIQGKSIYVLTVRSFRQILPESDLELEF
jgi:plasmid stabilization system protein ParE